MFLVTGATGELGRRIVHLLRDRGQPVRAFCRLLSDYKDLERKGAEIFIGDLRYERDLEKACQGIQYAIAAHGSNPTDSDAETIDYRANINLIDFAKAAGAQHVVYISVLGAERNYDDAPIFRAKRAVEQYLEASGLNYTILQPSGFASSLLPLARRFRETGLYFAVGDPSHRISIVSTDDLARIAVDSVTCEAALNRTFKVGGPRILTRGDIPRIFGQVFNREPIVINPPLLAFDWVRSLVGIFDAKLERELGTLRALLADEFFCTAEEVKQLESDFNLQLEPLESFLRRYVASDS